MLDLVAIVALFIEIRIEGEIARSAIADTVGIIGILYRILLLDMKSRCPFWEFFELWEKGRVEIEIHPIICRRIGVWEPIQSIKNRERYIGIIIGNELFAGRAAFAFVELAFIAKCETSTHPLFWTQCRRWDAVFFISKNRRYLIVKFEILVCYDEFFARETALLGLDYFFGREMRGHRKCVNLRKHN